jgi:hypothetical protein
MRKGNCRSKGFQTLIKKAQRETTNRKIRVGKVEDISYFKTFYRIVKNTDVRNNFSGSAM